MKTYIIKVLLVNRMSLREFNLILKERKLKLGGPETDTPQKIQAIIDIQRNNEAVAFVAANFQF